MIYFSSLAVGLPIGLIYAFAFDGGLVGSDSGVFSTIISILTAFGSVITTAFYAAMHIAFALHFYNIDERKEGGNLRSKIEGLSD
jgi:magnesium-transporting ATPase (P-type)